MSASNKIKIPAKTIVNRSEFGHYNFQYPNSDTAKVIKDCIADDLNWIQYDDKFAIAIPVEALSNKLSNIEKIVVWIPVKYKISWRY